MLHRQVCKPGQWAGDHTSPQTGKIFLESLNRVVEKRGWRALESFFKQLSLQGREQERNWLGMGNQTEDCVQN